MYDLYRKSMKYINVAMEAGVAAVIIENEKRCFFLANLKIESFMN